MQARSEIATDGGGSTQHGASVVAACDEALPPAVLDLGHFDARASGARATRSA